jgi:hypothetical protein
MALMGYRVAGFYSTQRHEVHKEERRRRENYVRVEPILEVRSVNGSFGRPLGHRRFQTKCLIRYKPTNRCPPPQPL